MKQLFTLMAMATLCSSTKAQGDPAQKDSLRIGNMIIVTNGQKNTAKPSDNTVSYADTSSPGNQSDTIRVGNMVIVTSGKQEQPSTAAEHDNEYVYKEKKRGNVSTNWFIVDLGFSNFNDQTNYASTGNYLYQRPGAAPFGPSDFTLNTGKSINVNIWLFMQRLNLIDHHLNLKYGVGIELNNYRYKSQLSYLESNPFTNNQAAPAPIIFRDSVKFSKNKLATDYFTVPVMLNYSSNPHRQNRGISISLGVSMGYLYSQRNKQVSEQRGKQTNNGGFDINPFKFSYVGEIGLGPVRLYGSYSPTSIYKRELDMRPYTLGIRLSNW